MMTNNQPWTAIVNPVNLSDTAAKKGNLTVIKKDSFGKKDEIRSLNFVTGKRYSFDDNGGGYQGL